jgi:hypothetical protein
MKSIISREWRRGCAVAGMVLAGVTAFAEPVTVQKVKDIVIYRDDLFHTAFPSVVRLPDQSLLLAFRRAPERRALGGKETFHVDPNSYLVGVRSRDNGEHWSEPELIYAHPFGGSQDPCLIALRDGTLLCASYGWAGLRPDEMANLTPPFSANQKNFIFLGGFMLKSAGLGDKWALTGKIPPLPGEFVRTPYKEIMSPFGRGALCEGKDGRLYWAVVRHDQLDPTRTSVHLLISDDKGATWSYGCPIASDAQGTFNETSLLWTAKGELVAFLRSGNRGGRPAVARSTDGGKSFGPWTDAGFVGEPLHALDLGDKGVLLTYGYRKPPYGIRARLLNSDCTDFATAQEIVLREDGGGADLGYPWSVRLDEKRVLVAYYFNQANGTRHIAGSIVEIR